MPGRGSRSLTSEGAFIAKASNREPLARYTKQSIPTDDFAGFVCSFPLARGKAGMGVGLAPSQAGPHPDPPPSPRGRGERRVERLTT